MAVLSDKQFLVVLGVGAVAVAVVYTKLPKVVVGIVSGNNELTKDTEYEGLGILGTLGAFFNEASGGTLQELGSTIGTKTAELIHGKVDVGGYDGSGINPAINLIESDEITKEAGKL